MNIKGKQKIKRANKRLNILVILLYWYPYSGPHTPIYAGLFKELRKRGHKITIITSFPHFRLGNMETWPEFRGKLFQCTSWEGMKLLRTYVSAPVFKSKRTALISVSYTHLTLPTN